MKAIQIHSYGGTETLRYEDTPTPTPGPRDVLVRVHAAGVNPLDWKIREGHLAQMIPLEMPLILGWDVSGVVERVGAQVTEFTPGDEVYSRPAINRPGAYAEYIAIDASELARKPAKLSHREAAGVSLAGITAWQALFDHGGLEAGQRVLIHAGAGGVGGFAIQLAKHAGAHVISTGSAKSAELIQGYGADQFIDYKTQRFEEVAGPVDLVFDTIGGETQARSVPLLADKKGRLVSIVQPPDEKALAAIGASGSFLMIEPNAEVLRKLAALIDDGKLVVTIDSAFPLTQAKLAHERSQSGHAKGKIILEVVG